MAVGFSMAQAHVSSSLETLVRAGSPDYKDVIAQEDTTQTRTCLLFSESLSFYDKPWLTKHSTRLGL